MTPLLTVLLLVVVVAVRQVVVHALRAVVATEDADRSRRLDDEWAAVAPGWSAAAERE